MVKKGPGAPKQPEAQEGVAKDSGTQKQPDAQGEAQASGPNRSRIAEGLAKEYHKSGKPGAVTFAEVCHRYTDMCKDEIEYLQKSMEMIDNTYFEFLNIGHDEFIKKYLDKKSESPK